MADLISRAAARDVINTWGRQKSEKVRMELLHRDLDALPAVDAVPVVRCRDCKYCYGIDNDPMTPYDGETDWYCEEFDVDWHVLTLDPNRFYCANGERRNE